MAASESQPHVVSGTKHITNRCVLCHKSLPPKPGLTTRLSLEISWIASQDEWHNCWIWIRAEKNKGNKLRATGHVHVRS